MLPFGEFVIPPIVTNPEEMTKLAQVLRVEFGYLWEDLLDEEIEDKMKGHILLAAFTYCSSGVDLWSEEGKYSIINFAVAIHIDDLVDDFGVMDDTLDGMEFKVLMESFDKLQSGNFDEGPTLVPKLVPYAKFFIDYVQNHKNKHRMGWARRQGKRSMSAVVTLMGNGKNGEEGLSEDTLLELNGYVYGLFVILELTVLYKEGDVCKEIRDDVIFERFGLCVAICGTLLNGIIGLGRDIRMDQVKDTPLLRDVVHNGLSLQQSFDKYVGLFQNAVQDLRVLGKKLKARYPDDPALAHYVNLGQEMIDQQLFCYMFISRYGETNAKVVKI
jgi:hypothetical protein